MPKGIYQRTSTMMTGKYKRTEEHLKILKEQIIKYKYKGPYCGFQKGHPPFRGSFKKGNKPIAPFQKGHTAWNKGTHNSWNKGKKFYHPKQFKKGVYQGYGFEKGFIPWNKGKYGEGNANWQGGKSYEIYPLGWNRTYKEQIRRRDEYKCQLCNCPEIENSRKLDIHHIDYNKRNILADNLISLCRSCHSKTFHNREYWKEYFQSWKLKLSIMPQ